MFTLKVISENEKETLNKFMQFYFYDFSEFLPIDIEDNGLFKDYSELEYYFSDRDSHFPYFIEVEGKMAGFVLVKREADGTYSIAEFFIMKRYRKSGLGKLVACQIFDMYKGNWYVMQIEPNLPAQAFWRKVIHEHTNGQFKEEIKEKKVFQYFNNANF